MNFQYLVIQNNDIFTYKSKTELFDQLNKSLTRNMENFEQNLSKFKNDDNIIDQIQIKLANKSKIKENKKELTKWEKFAQSKNIQKKKRSRMVFDEQTKQYYPRWGQNSIVKLRKQRDTVESSEKRQIKKNQHKINTIQNQINKAQQNTAQMKDNGQKVQKIRNRKIQQNKNGDKNYKNISKEVINGVKFKNIYTV